MAKFFNVDVVSFNAVLFAIAAVYAPIACAQECTLPRGQHITWDKMDGYWYEVATDQSALSEAAGPVVVHDIKPVPGGFEMKINEKNIKNGKKVETFHAHWRGDGRYADDPSDDQVALKDLEAEHPKSDFATVEKETKSYGETAFFTDYDNYFIGVGCGGEGESYVFLMHRKPNPGLDDIMQLWMKMIEIGGGWENIPLHLVDKLPGSAGGPKK